MVVGWEGRGVVAQQGVFVKPVGDIDTEPGSTTVEPVMDNFLEFLGPGGFATPDDVEALESCQRAYRNHEQAGWNDISKGMMKAVPATDDEEQMRCFWRGWNRRMSQAAAS